MVHVLDLLGCVVHAGTTELALQATPQAIRSFLAFLSLHGEQVDPDAPFETPIQEHVMQGSWLGYGDPTPGFSPDFEPLSRDTLEQGVQRLAWMIRDLVERLSGLDPAQWEAEPEHGRTLAAILEHMAESQVVYLRYLLGPQDGVREELRSVRSGGQGRLAAFQTLYDLHIQRLGALSGEELERSVPHGQVLWTAHRALRRSLEHAWEHVQEIDARLALS